MKTQEDVKQFVWFESFTRAVEAMPDRVAQAMLTLAIIEYGALGKEPQANFKEDCKFDDTKKTDGRMIEAVFEACRINIDNSVKAYENGKKGAAHGKKGGRPRKNESKEEARARREAEGLITEPAKLNVDLYEPSYEVDEFGNTI